MNERICIDGWVDPVLFPSRCIIESGGMSSGKSSEFYNRCKALMAKPSLEVALFKPDIDKRHPPEWILPRMGVSDVELTADDYERLGLPCKSISVKDPYQIIDYLNERGRVDVVGIEEMQFFNHDIVRIVQELCAAKLSVLGTALELNYRGEPFSPADQLLCTAHEVHKHYGWCTEESCFNRGVRTQRYTDGVPSHWDEKTVIPDTKENRERYQYKLVCTQHHIVPGKPDLTRKLFVVPNIQYAG